MSFKISEKDAVEMPEEVKCALEKYYYISKEFETMDLSFRLKPTIEEFGRGVVSPSARKTATEYAMEFPKAADKLMTRLGSKDFSKKLDEAMRKSFFEAYPEVDHRIYGKKKELSPKEENDKLREQEGETEWK